MKLDARFLTNLAAFQIGWFACVLGGANALPLAGTMTVAVAVGLHLFVVRNPPLELLLVIAASAIGLVWDSLVVSLGLMSYPSGTFAEGFAPHWIIAMWALFATTLNVSMGWLKGRPVLAALLGGIGGPMAYLTGYKLGGVVIPDLWLGLIVQGIGWAVMMPLLTVLATRLNGVDAPLQPAYDDDSARSRRDV